MYSRCIFYKRILYVKSIQIYFLSFELLFLFCDIIVNLLFIFERCSYFITHLYNMSINLLSSTSYIVESLYYNNQNNNYSIMLPLECFFPKWIIQSRNNIAICSYNIINNNIAKFHWPIYFYFT